MAKEHYKKLVGNPTHAGVFILPEGKDIEYIVVDHTEKRDGELVNGVKKDVVLAFFKPNPYTNLAMVLNVTNSDRLCKLAGKTPWELLDVKNVAVRLTYEPTNKGDGLRISKIPPVLTKHGASAPTTQATTATTQQPTAKKETLTTAHENFAKSVSYLKGGGNIDELKKRFEISPAMEETLKQAAL